jgi:hypothetical protein
MFAEVSMRSKKVLAVLGSFGLSLALVAGCAEGDNSGSKITGVPAGGSGGPTDSSSSSYESYSKQISQGTAGGYAGKTSGPADPSKRANSTAGEPTKTADPGAGSGGAAAK